MIQLTLILDNLRSSYNVGAILRTCDAAGVRRVIACGTTPYPRTHNDLRDPVVSARNHREIAKTALGAEETVMVEYINNTLSAMTACKKKNCTLIGLEKVSSAHNILNLTAPSTPIALIVGNEVEGLSDNVLAACELVCDIPQRGTKESLNVSVATGIALYALMFK